MSRAKKILRVAGWVVVVLLAATAVAGKVELVDDLPPAPKPTPGKITGQLTPAEKILAVTAVSRVTGKRYLPQAYDKKTGKFTFANMPGDANYDICVDMKTGRQIEGVDLSFVDERLLRLAGLRRKQLKLPPPQTPPPFMQNDADAIIKFITDGGGHDFMDYRRVLYVRGRGDRATVLLEQMRTTDFHKGAGQIVWRIELWYFQRRGGGWERIPNVEKMLQRLRTTPAEWRKVSVEYYPRLSAYVDAQGKCPPVKFTIPAQPDESRGRVADTPLNLKTKPHLLGVPKTPK